MVDYHQRPPALQRAYLQMNTCGLAHCLADPRVVLNNVNSRDGISLQGQGYRGAI